MPRHSGAWRLGTVLLALSIGVVAAVLIPRRCSMRDEYYGASDFSGNRTTPRQHPRLANFLGRIADGRQPPLFETFKRPIPLTEQCLRIGFLSFDRKAPLKRPVRRNSFPFLA